VISNSSRRQVILDLFKHLPSNLSALTRIEGLTNDILIQMAVYASDNTVNLLEAGGIELRGTWVGDEVTAYTFNYRIALLKKMRSLLLSQAITDPNSIVRVKRLALAYAVVIIDLGSMVRGFYCDGYDLVPNYQQAVDIFIDILNGLNSSGEQVPMYAKMLHHWEISSRVNTIARDIHQLDLIVRDTFFAG